MPGATNDAEISRLALTKFTKVQVSKPRAELCLRPLICNGPYDVRQ